MNMLNKLYRALVIGRAKSAAVQTVNFLGERDLADLGHSRSSFISASIENIVNEFDAAEKSNKARSFRHSLRDTVAALFSTSGKKNIA
jgi:predicted GNAT superfamily acetyltransferase